VVGARGNDYRFTMSCAPRDAAIVLLATALNGCAGSGKASDPHTANANAVQRLQGDWILAEFRPRESLEPALQALLNAQLRNMNITIENDALDASGPGITAHRTFTIRDVTGDQFSATLADPTGSSYDIGASFLGRDVGFASRTNPWVGEGRLERPR
jgi:hypothetical protein